jgi:acyl-CoA reductase-like NAD-dependent aldehyde dehydrogenase
VYDQLIEKLKTAYKSVRIGDPLEEGTICGPVHTKGAVRDFKEGLLKIQEHVKKKKKKKLIFPRAVKLSSAVTFWNVKEISSNPQ